ncbi:MAG: hypothetical protein O7F16_12785, partial [Acidobacteria bacterium]|nr:hypothetical protein [Acidobacteriota bacterium]
SSAHAEGGSGQGRSEEAAGESRQDPRGKAQGCGIGQEPPAEYAAPAAAQPSAARPPAAKYKFMGYMGNPNRKLAVLLDDGEVVLKREGETLGDDFVVREIRFDSVELGYTDERFKDEKTLIPMGN